MNSITGLSVRHGQGQSFVKRMEGEGMTSADVPVSLTIIKPG
ncbi:MAG: hypothetical protein AAFU64_02715 [Bacteroidota bacterium]